MDVHDFELFHGIVLTKLVRSDRPITLRMIETRPAEAWSAYTINDEVILYLKYSTKPRDLEDGSSVWTFTFAIEHLQELTRLRKGKEVYVALICGQRSIATGSMHVCFLESCELDRIISVGLGESQTISVKFIPGKRLRVWGSQSSSKAPLLVTRCRLDDWQVPGS